MARKSNYLKQLNYKDEKLCSIVKNSHHISQAQALLIVSRNRLANFEKQGVLKKLHYMDNNKKEIIYELTKKGRSFISRNFPHLSGSFYTAGTAYQHNVIVAQQIIECPSNKWYNEKDLREMLLQEIQESDNRWELMRMLERGEISVPDGGYCNADGSIQCIEVINENYTSTQLKYKQNFESITKIPITYIKQK